MPELDAERVQTRQPIEQSGPSSDTMECPRRGVLRVLASVAAVRDGLVPCGTSGLSSDIAAEPPGTLLDFGDLDVTNRLRDRVAQPRRSPRHLAQSDPQSQTA